MELKEPRPKKHNKLLPSLPLPIIINADGTIFKFMGYFNGFSVTIPEKDDMKNINTMGCFGKGNFSRGYPTFATVDNKPPFVRKRVFHQRKTWKVKFPTTSKSLKKVIVVPDSDDENEDYFTNLTVEYQFDADTVNELLHLTLEEAFFLVSCVGCLNIYDKDLLLTEHQLWKKFNDSDLYFVQNFVVYYYFRSKNWVVKPGIKFGGDFLLYKDGPPFYHASYVVIIDVLDSETLQRRKDLCRRSMAAVNICGLNRLCETVGKELLICQLLWPSNLEILQSEHISKISINEVIIKRWISSQNRELEES